MSIVFRQPLLHWLIPCTFLLFSSFSTLINAQNFTLKEAISLQSDNRKSHWLSPSIIPSNSQQMLLAEHQGKVFLFTESDQKTLPLIDLNTVLTKQNFMQLTAVALHPSFALKDQPGSGTLYTAHTEKYQTKLKKKRLHSSDKLHPEGVDVVISQWHFEQGNAPTIDAQSNREVLRINLPNEAFHISQLSFNPYLPSWDDNYGLIHIILANDTKPHQSPLLSGAILRINPEQFGLKNYTLPSDNPFIRNQEIIDEVVALGLGKVNKLLWQKNNMQQVVVHHQINQQQMLSAINVGEDKRNSKKFKTLWQSKNEQQLSLPIFYNGRELKQLRGHWLFLLQSSNRSLELLALPEAQMLANEKSPQIFKTKLPKQVLTASNTDMYLTADKQLRIFEQEKGTLAQLSLPTVAAAKNEEAGIEEDSTESIAEPDSETNESGNGILIAMIVLITLMGLYWFKFRNRPNNKHLHLYQFFARFTLSKNQQALSFYDRHRKSAKCSLLVKDIVSSELLLNNEPLNTINKASQSGFSNSLEVEIRHAFSLEYRNKMIDDKVRHFDIILTDNNNKTYPVCLYYRKGNQRLTKIKYEKALEQCIDWCWFIAKQINPEHCSERTVATQQIKKSVINSKIKPIVKTEALSKATDEKIQIETAPAIDLVSKTEKRLTELEAGVGADTAIVDALDKLVDLKQKGFINEREFELAKAKLLQDLLEN